MTTKDYLNQAFRIDQRISSKLEQIESLKALATRVTTTLSDMPRTQNSNHVIPIIILFSTIGNISKI